MAALCVEPGDIGPVGHLVETVEDSPVGVEAEEGHQEAQQAQHQPHHRHVLRPIRKHLIMPYEFWNFVISLSCGGSSV